MNSNDGVCITESANNILKYNIIKYNDMDGVQLVDSSYNTISYNDISNNVNWRGIILIGSSNNTFTGNTISNNWRGIWIKQSSDCNHFSDNLVSHNTYMNNNGGIKLEGGTCNYNRFYNNTIEYNDDFGIFFSDTSNNYVTGNVIRYNQGFGFLMDDSSYIALKNNTFISHGINIYDWDHNGLPLQCWNSHIIENNTANSLPIRYYKNSNNFIVPSNTSQLIIANCDNYSVQNLDIQNVDSGIQLGFSSNITINNSIFSNIFTYGIYIYKSNSNTILKNDISDISYSGIHLINSANNRIIANNISEIDDDGIFLSRSSNTNISNNNVSNNEDGMLIGHSSDLIISNNILNDNQYEGINMNWQSNNNIIKLNIISNNGHCGLCFHSALYYNNISENYISNNNLGIYAHSVFQCYFSKNEIVENNGGINLYSLANGNRISENNISGNINYGIKINKNYNQQGSFDNVIFHNNLIDNNQNAFDEFNNTWNNSYPSGGNYFDDYSGHGFEHGMGTYPPIGQRLRTYLTLYIKDLVNGYELPIIFFDACLTSKLDFVLDDLLSYKGYKPFKMLYLLPGIDKDMKLPCYAWYFVKHEGGGAIATIGATRTAFGGVDSGAGKMSIEFFKTYKSSEMLGQMMTKAQNAYITDVPNDEFTVEEFTLLGDPSLKLGGYP